MPLYIFDCGEHRQEQIARVGRSFSTCHCGEPSVRVFDLSAAQVHSYGSDFHMTRQMRDLRDEAIQWKHRAIKEKQEAEANGFRLEREK